MFAEKALTTNVTAPQIGTTYYTKVAGLTGGLTSYQTSMGSATCDGVCPDGTVVSFVYRNTMTVCDATPVTSCVACSHYCAHLLSVNGDISSKDMCYGSMLIPPTPSTTLNALRSFWGGYSLGIMSASINGALTGSALSSSAVDCLSSYVGLRTPATVGVCYSTLGAMCFGAYCIDNDGYNAGLNNAPPGGTVYPKDVKSKLRCRINGTPNNYALLKACDECVVESLIPMGSSWTVPSFIDQNVLRSVCTLVTYSVSTTFDISATLSLANWLFKQPSQTFLELRGGLSAFDTAVNISQNAKQATGVYGVDVGWYFETNDVVDKALPLFTYANSDIRYMTFNASSGVDTTAFNNLVSKATGVRGSFSVSLLCSTFPCMQTQYSLTQHFDVDVNSVPSSDFVGGVALITNVFSENQYVDVVDNVQSQRINYYFYIGTGNAVYCPSITKYFPGAVVTYQPLMDTFTVPYSNFYISTSQTFNCTKGAPKPAVQCPSSVTQGVSLTTLLTSTAQPNVVLFNVQNNCFIFSNNSNAQLCNFVAAGSSSSSQFFMLNNRVTSVLDDRGPYHVGLLGYYKIIDDFDHVVEMFPVDIMCSTPDLNSIPTCLTAVCGTNQQCLAANANGVCSMDASMRDSVSAVLNRFTEAQSMYTKMTAIKSNWAQNTQVRNRRFVEWIALGLSIASMAVASEAYSMAQTSLAASEKAVAASKVAVSVSMEALSASAAATSIASSALTLGGQAYALANRTAVALTQLTGKVDQLAQQVNIIDGRLNNLETTVTVLGDKLYTISTNLQKNIDSTNSRISDLQNDVNARFSSLTNFINGVALNLATGLSYLQSASMYYQQLTVFANHLHSATEKLMMQTTMYSTCLQSIFKNRLYGCPLTNTFLERYPDYLLTSAVEGALFKDTIMSVMYRVPTSVTPMAVYTIIVKGFVVGNSMFTVDTSNVVLGADNEYYLAPSCDANYCAPLIKNVNMANCMRYVSVGDFANMQIYCPLKACAMIDCSDVNKVTMYNGTFNMPTQPFFRFVFTDPSNITNPVVQQYIYRNINTTSNMTDISDSLIAVQNSQIGLQHYIQATNETLNNYIKNFTTADIYATINSSLSNYLPDNINKTITEGQKLAAETLAAIDQAKADADAALKQLDEAQASIDALIKKASGNNQATNVAIAALVLVILFAVANAALFIYLFCTNQLSCCGPKRPSGSDYIPLVNRRSTAL